MSKNIKLDIAKGESITLEFKEIGYADELGSGVRNLFKYSKAYSGTDPQLIEEDVFRIILARPAVEVTEQEPKIPFEDDVEEKDDLQSTERGEKLSENRQKILDVMRKDPTVSQIKLVDIIGIGSTNIEKNIKYLKVHGWIRRVGSAKGGHWEVMQ